MTTKRGSAAATKVEKILSDFQSSNVDLEGFAREFVRQCGGMSKLAALLAAEIKNAPDGSVAKANLLGKALDLIKATEGGGADDVVVRLTDEDATAVLNQLLED